jgi:hypothetical protein
LGRSKTNAHTHTHTHGLMWWLALRRAAVRLRQAQLYVVPALHKIERHKPRRTASRSFGKRSREQIAARKVSSAYGESS